MAESRQGPTGERWKGGRASVCPHCWHPFPVSATLAITRNPSLGKDRIVQDPDDDHLRFLPSRFSFNGNPLDPAGRECLEFACPDCHLSLSRANLTAEPVFTSVVGAPRAGKTFLLTAAAWQMRRTLQAKGCSFQDASPRENMILQDYGQRIFQPERPDEVIKPFLPTERRDQPNSVRVRIRDNTEQTLLKPFQFHFRPSREMLRAAAKANPAAATGMPAETLLVLYDNPGQDYLSMSADGIDSARHIMHSKVLVFVLNPIGEKRLRDRCDQEHPLVRSPPRDELRPEWRQELVFSEIVSRVARLKGLRAGEPLGARVVVAVTKSDIWPEMYSMIRDDEYTAPGQVNVVSGAARDIVRRAWPEFVAAVDRADQRGRARFFPVSVVNPETSNRSADGTGQFQFRGTDIRPRWTEVPFLWSILRAMEARGGQLE